MLQLEWKQAESTDLPKTVLMFYLSNGPCKLAPLWPEIHNFPRTHQFSIRQVIRETVPKGRFDFCTFQTQLYFIPARTVWKIAETSEGDLRARRGNGAENSSQSKGREGSWERKPERLLQSLWHPIGCVPPPRSWVGGVGSQQTHHPGPQRDFHSHCSPS